jgi:hypothetical protein
MVVSRRRERPQAGFIFQIILTPILSGVSIAHLEDLQRSFVGLAVSRLEPSGLPMTVGGCRG